LLYRLCDEEYVWNTFKDDALLKLVMAGRENARTVSQDLIKPVAITFGIPDASMANTEMAQKIKKIHTEAALFATQNVVTWAEAFARENDKKLMVMLSFGRGNVERYLTGRLRFDQSFVDWLAGKSFPVVDMLEHFAADYRKYNASVDPYLTPLYNGHHTPRGNFFTAWAIKNQVVEWLEPKPRPYG